MTYFWRVTHTVCSPKHVIAGSYSVDTLQESRSDQRTIFIHPSGSSGIAPTLGTILDGRCSLNEDMLPSRGHIQNCALPGSAANLVFSTQPSLGPGTAEITNSLRLAPSPPVPLP